VTGMPSALRGSRFPPGAAHTQRTCFFPKMALVKIVIGAASSLLALLLHRRIIDRLTSRLVLTRTGSSFFQDEFLSNFHVFQTLG
jgi:hypothetical protein